ncbi:MAG: hypothetical protein ACE5H0_09920 [Bacteroidota bacterium]
MILEVMDEEVSTLQEMLLDYDARLRVEIFHDENKKVEEYFSEKENCRGRGAWTTSGQGGVVEKHLDCEQ